MKEGRGGRPFGAATIGKAVLVILFLIAAATASQAALQGSKHDFSGKGWGTTETCVFCHTPHNAVTVAGTKAPLWSHQMSAATYTLYSSASLQYVPQQPKGPSKLCLSCHDGTVAIDSFGNRAGSHFAEGSANIGTVLANDHPISIQWAHQTIGNNNCMTCHYDFIHGNFLLTYTPMYLDGGTYYLECGSCHEPHNKFPGNGKMLRYSMTESQLCLLCHGK